MATNSSMVSLYGFKIELLTDENYTSWMAQARPILESIKVGTSNMYKVIFERKARDTELGTPVDEGHQEDCRDILNMIISRNVWIEVEGYKYPIDILNYLAEKDKAIMESRHGMWHSEIARLRLDEKKGMQDYLNSATSLVEKIRGNGGTIENRTISNFLIDGLPEAYKPHLLYCNQFRDNTAMIKNALLEAESTMKGLA